MYYDISTLQDISPRPANETGSRNFIEQSPIRLPEARTEGLQCDYIEMVPIRLDEMVPLSFLNALSDYNAGRVVDIEVALNDPPPGV
jgi:hypothetical protein